ncbi:MAG: phosphate acyltransferase PlsX [Clostridiales Family XIII bacterium]|jgi:glycerol-3-phosphate acyltransferase PlsX|nr:phosphate acyltransferase PlsX [Clostridiales Family XIII bacterium]
MRIILDGMGGDNAPADIVEGAVLASKEMEHEIVIAGDEALISAELSKYKYDKSKVTILATTEVITTAESPTKAIRTKKDSSMVRGMQEVKDGNADMFLSAGNSGALLAGGIFVIGRIKGIDRPALGSTYPILGSGIALLVDAGANADVKPGNLLEFAYMGSIYMKEVLGVKNPRVGLVNLGTEPGKGTKILKDAYPLLENSGQKKLINFVGNVEGRDVPFGEADVIVCDGLVGNVILKLTEGLALSILSLLKQKFMTNVKTKLAAVMLGKQMGEMKKEFDYSEYGGAPILGIKKPIIKVHGSATANMVKSGIISALPYIEKDVVGTITEHVKELKAIEEEQKEEQTEEQNKEEISS